jgi:hypothetical protein
MCGRGWPITCIRLIRGGVHREKCATEPASRGEFAPLNKSTGAAKRPSEWRFLPGAGEGLFYLKDHFDLDGDAKG